MQLQEILEGVAILDQAGETSRIVPAMTFDSRKVKKGDLFFAISGTLTDGHIYIDQVSVAGAAVIVCERMPEELKNEITYIQVEDTAKALGLMAANFYGRPSLALKLVGITGTNGKTTIATILFNLFRELGYHTGLISTVQNQIDDRIIPSTHTTPDPIELNKLLSEMVNAGCSYCFMEVSSHAIVQHRITGLEFAGGVFSNITHDHLDFHHTFSNYIKAKKTFFDELPKHAFALTNTDDKNGMVMMQNTHALKKTYALKQIADFQARVVDNRFSGLHLEIDHTDVFFKLVGSFNAYNLLAVYGTAVQLGIDRLEVLTLLSNLGGAEGRFEAVPNKARITGIVDYAHTPDAVQNVLSTIHDIRKGTEQVITVIGCGGDRDKGKRPVMAQVACDWSDKVILTSDNPRTEDPIAILKDMEAGVSPTNLRKTLIIADRREAIKTACHLANAGDIILIAGKGHEKYQDINGVKNHFDDKEVLQEQLNLIG